MTHKDAVLAIMKKYIMELLPNVKAEDIHAGVRMADLGANSIDRADIIVATMEELGLKLPLASFGKAKNIGELIDIFLQASNAPC